MGFRNVKYGVNGQQLHHSRESDPGQIATKSRSQMIESEAAKSGQRGYVRWRASVAEAYYCHPFQYLTHNLAF